MAGENIDNKFVDLRVTFQRISENDSAGLMGCESHGWPVKFLYSNTGSEHGLAQDSDDTDDKLIEFGGDLYELVKKYFGDVPPVILKNENF